MTPDSVCKYGCKTLIHFEKIHFKDGFVYELPIEQSGEIHECPALLSYEYSKDAVPYDGEYNENNISNDLASMKGHYDTATDAITEKDFINHKKFIQKQLAALSSPLWGTFFELADAYFLNNELDDAEKAYSIENLIDPENGDPKKGIANTLIQKNDNVKAIQYLTNMLQEIEKENKTSYEFSEAGQNPNKLSLDDLDNVYYLLGAAHYKLDDFTKAIDYLKKSTEKILDSKHRKFWHKDVFDLFGKCLYEEKKYKDAKEAFEKARELEKVKKTPFDVTPEIHGIGSEINERHKETISIPFASSNPDDLIAEIEISLRETILGKMQKDQDWEKLIDQKIWSKAKQRYEEIKKYEMYHSEEYRIIDYVEFSDYWKIFKPNWKYFEEVFWNQIIFFGKLQELRVLRNFVAHHRGPKLGHYLNEKALDDLRNLHFYFMTRIMLDRRNNTK